MCGISVVCSIFTQYSVHVRFDNVIFSGER